MYKCKQLVCASVCSSSMVNQRVTAAILSQLLRHNTLPHIRTENMAVYTGGTEFISIPSYVCPPHSPPGSHPWTSCDKLHFAHSQQPLSPHPDTILMLISLTSSWHSQRPHSYLGKRKSEEPLTEADPTLPYPALSSCPSSQVMVRKRLRICPEDSVHVSQ